MSPSTPRTKWIPQPTSTSRAPLALALASFAGLAACGLDTSRRKSEGTETRTVTVSDQTVYSSFSLGPARYGDCGELRAELSAIRERAALVSAAWKEQAIDRAVARAVSENSASSAAPASGASRPDSGATASASAPAVQADKSVGDITTNVQEAAVDEGDTFKASTHHIFARAGIGLVVVDRRTMRRLGELAFDPTGSLREAYVHGDKLLVLESLGGVERAKGGFNRWFERTRVTSYALTPGAMPRKVTSVDVEGALGGSRLHAGRLVLVVADDLAWAPPEHLVRSDAAGVACRDVWKPPFRNTAAVFTKLLSYDASNLAARPAATGFLGAGEELYVSANAVYVGTRVAADTPVVAPMSVAAARGRGFATSAPLARVSTAAALDAGAARLLLDSREAPAAEDRLFIQRVEMRGKDGFGASALGEVSGRTKDRWAYKELAGGKHLAVATTTGSLFKKGASAAKNHLTVLELDGARLRRAGSLDGFGRNEDIRAVRYVGAMAYVVTFKKTDPLFAIDLSNPRAPRAQGELKIPGYSTYLHPVAPGRLLGVGYETVESGEWAIRKGVQVSLFDVSNPEKPMRLDVKVLGSSGSDSIVNQDSRAFFHDAENSIVGLPVTLSEPEGSGDGAVSGGRGFSGAVFYEVRGNALIEAGRLTHQNVAGPTCASWYRPSVERIFKLAGKIVTLADDSVREWASPAAADADREAVWADERRCGGVGGGVMGPFPGGFVD